MEFWGVEVKAGQNLKVQPGDDKILHLSQASLGEVKKQGSESVPLFVKIGDQKLVLGTLSPEKCTQIPFDLVFEKEFELSHNWKNGSVYFCGYSSVMQDESEDFSDSESDFEEDHLLSIAENGKPEQKVEQAKPLTNKAIAAKPDASGAKPKVKVAEPNKDNKSKDGDDSDDDEDDDDDDDSEEDESDDEFVERGTPRANKVVNEIGGRTGEGQRELYGGNPQLLEDDMLDAGVESDDDDDDDEESSDEEDEETPKRGEKRSLESDKKTPTPVKKAKLITPQKTDGKKGGGHTATPFPAKQAGKTPANNEKSKTQTRGQVPCKSCSKTFNSESALESHAKAKHSGGK